VEFRRTLRLAVLIAFCVTPGCDRGARPNYTGQRAPDFTVADGSTSIHLASYRGQVVLLNFWWSQCAPCIAELPSLEQLHHDDPKVAILAVSIDENAENYTNFLVRHHVDLITVRDPDQTAARLFGTKMWPESYIIDRQGFIRRKFVESTDWSSPEIRAFLNSL
jgi:cytochrome c biogenesis protein CcmG, thiol:disulfide interchange protein DsbE